MTKKINLTDETAKAVVDTSQAYSRVAPEEVASALNAETVGHALDDALGPITLLTIQDEISARLRSTGGRPALSGATKRAKIPVNDLEWSRLEVLAEELSSAGSRPSAGQVASVVLSTALRGLFANIAVTGARQEILRDLAARTLSPTR